MFVEISIAVVISSVLLTWVMLAGFKRYWKKTGNKSAARYSAGCLISILIPIISLNLVVVLISLADYSGSCYGFTDGVWPCGFSEFLSSELVWGNLIFAPVEILIAIGIAAVFSGFWLKDRNQSNTSKESS